MFPIRSFGRSRVQKFNGLKCLNVIILITQKTTNAVKQNATRMRKFFIESFNKKNRQVRWEKLSAIVFVSIHKLVIHTSQILKSYPDIIHSQRFYMHT